MHRTSTGWYEWKMGIIWSYRAYKRMSWSIRLATSKTVRISPYMYERKISKAPETNKLKTINGKDKTFTVLIRDNDDYVTTNC